MMPCGGRNRWTETTTTEQWTHKIGGEWSSVVCDWSPNEEVLSVVPSPSSVLFHFTTFTAFSVPHLHFLLDFGVVWVASISFLCLSGLFQKALLDVSVFFIESVLLKMCSFYFSGGGRNGRCGFFGICAIVFHVQVSGSSLLWMFPSRRILIRRRHRLCFPLISMPWFFQNTQNQSIAWPVDVNALSQSV